MNRMDRIRPDCLWVSHPVDPVHPVRISSLAAGARAGHKFS
jgi:hypothetical protein